VSAPEVLPQPAEFFRMSYCSYCIHERKAHVEDGACERCQAEGNGFWPECPRFSRQCQTPGDMGLVDPLARLLVARDN
jgi:hypothetical protein